MYGVHMNRIIKFTSINMICVAVALFFVACTNQAPWDYSNVTWYSEDPAIELNTTYSGEPSIGYIKNDGDCIEVYLRWGPPTYTFSIYLYNPNTNFSPGTDELLLRGKVKYNSTSATLVIKEDNFFGNKYSAIKLNRREN